MPTLRETILTALHARLSALPLETARHCPSRGVSLPAKGYHDLIDRRAIVGAEYLDQRYLLGAAAAAHALREASRFGWCSSCVSVASAIPSVQ